MIDSEDLVEAPAREVCHAGISPDALAEEIILPCSQGQNHGPPHPLRLRSAISSQTRAWVTRLQGGRHLQHIGISDCQKIIDSDRLYASDLQQIPDCDPMGLRNNQQALSSLDVGLYLRSVAEAYVVAAVPQRSSENYGHRRPQRAGIRKGLPRDDAAGHLRLENRGGNFRRGELRGIPGYLMCADLTEKQLPFP